ncbi:MAG: chain-length determining protein [Ectothiorhodospiraceae bacterium]|nr:chain-length determining protein [Ectothiorhodospiraceae bacterium]
MHELYAFILGELRGAWRFRWYALLVAWVVVIAGVIVVLKMPDQYRVDARVQVDTESVLRPLLDGLAVSPNLSDRVAMMANTLLNRDNLERIARESDLLITANDAVEEQRVLNGLRSNISLSSGGRNNVYTIAYESGDPEVSRKVVQSVLDILMDQTLGVTRTDSDTATDFLERQVREYEDRLRSAEERLANFKRENVGLLPDQGGRDYYQRLRAAEDNLEELEAELRTAQNRRNALRREIELMESGQQSREVINPRVAALDEQIQASRERLEDLRLRYTDQHPDVIAAEAQIERLQQEREVALNQRETTIEPDRLSSNPVYQELQIRMNEQNSEIAALETRISDQRRRIENLLSQVDDITRVETQLADLSRDYEVTRDRYQMLLGRLSTAQLSTEAGTSGGQVRFRVLDPPLAPNNPSGPPRKLYLAALLPLGLGFGGGIAYLLHQLRPVFQSRRSLSELTGRPVLGSVSLVMSPMQRRLKFGAVAVFGLAVLCLVGAVMASVLFAELGAEHLQDIVRRLPL